MQAHYVSAHERKPSGHLRDKFLREVASARLPGPADAQRIVEPETIASLPEPVRRLMGFAGVVGRPFVGSIRAHWMGRFRLEREQPWLNCEAWQFDLRSPVTRIFHMSLRMGGLLPVLVRDNFISGRGCTVARALDAFSVANDHSEETAVGQLVTYLNDAVLLAPALLLVPEVTFRQTAEDSFVVTLSDRGREVSASVELDVMGRTTCFSTTDRFLRDPARPDHMLRTRWSTPVQGWQWVAGRMVPTSAKAIWHLRDGDFTYADFHLSPNDFSVNAA
jgi:hypothetical protein